MNTRNFLNLGLALALAGLMALAFYESGNVTPDNNKLLTQLKPTDIQKIVIKQTQQGGSPENTIPATIVLKKTNDQWQMDEPYNNQANTFRINKLLAIAQTKSHAQYSAAEINLNHLKLSSPDLIISLNDNKLLFGTTDALKGYRFIQINNTVHLITDRFSHLIRGQTAQLLSPALLPKNTIITRLVLPGLTLQTNETGRHTKPDNKSISADQLQQLLDEWRFARALRVSKLPPVARDKADGIKSTTIEVQNDKNQLLHFDLIRQDDEIILQRADIGLSYYFTAETGERLLTLPSVNSGSTNH